MRRRSFLAAAAASVTPRLPKQDRLIAGRPPWGASALIDKTTVLGAISRHDPVWEKAAETWNQGLLLGNGDLGVNVWGRGKPLVFSIDKADVWETRHWQPPRTFSWANFRRLVERGVVQGPDASWKKDWGRPKRGGQDVEPYATRIPVGRLELMPAGKPVESGMTLSLTEATATGTLKTDVGRIRWRCFAAAAEPVIVIEYETTEKEADATLRMRNYTGADPIPGPVHRMLREVFGYPAPEEGEAGEVSYWSQSMPQGGEYAVAWRRVALSDRRALVYITIAFTRDRKGAKADAIETIRGFRASDLDRLRTAHRDWWANYYLASFLSIPDTRLEALYWMEIYKLGSATRPGKAPITLVGPWAQDGIMPAWQGDYHWDINVQMTYWPIYAANRLELGLPLYDMLDRSRPLLAKTARDVIGSGGEFLLVSTGIDCIPHYGWPDGQLAFSALPWAVRAYWRHWEYSQDREFLRTRALPIMKAALEPYLHILERGADGRLHVPLGLSPEYRGSTGRFWGPDPVHDLSLIRFLLRCLIEGDAALGGDDPQRERWQRVLAELADYPVDAKEGLMVRADLHYESSHRHFSHLMPIYPLALMTLEKDRELVERSVRHWILRGHGEWVGFSFAWAASIAAYSGRASLARSFLLDYVDRFVTENSLMFQGPVNGSDMTIWGHGRSLTLEAGFGAADAVQNMLLQSHDGVVRVFPASPPAWYDASIWQMRAQGAFLVSASRRRGKTRFVHVLSEKGGPLRLRTDFAAGKVRAFGNGNPKPYRNAGGDLLFETESGEEVLVYTGAKPELRLPVVGARPDEEHFFGVKTVSRW